MVFVNVMYMHDNLVATEYPIHHKAGFETYVHSCHIT